MGERYYCKHCGLDIGNSKTRMCRDRDGDMCEPKPRTAKREERAHVDTIADLRAELDSARLGCDFAFRREPTREEMRAALAGSRDGEAFIAMGGWTVRTCRVCSEPVAGGPTACVRCVDREETADLRAKLAAAEADRDKAVEAYDEIASNNVLQRAIDEARHYLGATDGERVRDAARRVAAERDAATARAERAEAKLAEVSAHFDAVAAELMKVDNRYVDLTAAKARAEAEAAAMRVALHAMARSGITVRQARRLAGMALQSTYAGAALLREVEAGRRLAEAARPLVRGSEPHDCVGDLLDTVNRVGAALDAALADYDAARGAK